MLSFFRQPLKTDMDLLEISLVLCFLVLQVGSQDQAHDFLKAHNDARKEVGVPAMEWDHVLEANTLSYAQGMIDNCSVVHDYGTSGQNLAWSSGDFSGIDAVEMWVDEKKDYDFESNSCAPGKVCGHYTQVIWSNSTKLGCAKARCNNGGTFIACNYYPPGNFIGRRPTDGIEAVAPSPHNNQSPDSGSAGSPHNNQSIDSGTGIIPSKEGENRRRLVIGLIIGAAATIFSLGFMTWFISSQKRKREKQVDDHVFDMFFTDEFGNEMGPRKFSLNELAKVTNNFDDENKLGEGGFGSVYRGYLKDLDSYIAVKRVSRTSKQGIKEYAAEVKIISRLRHRNLVKLIGWSHERGELLLIYEFMANGSLDSHLFQGKSMLTWDVRYKIVKDLALALLYLHEEWDFCVIHRDIKTSNIMLDSSFNAKLGDFGLARLVDHAKGLKSTLLAGTVGYMAPECLSSGKASKESDVYSFGVVALEIACGRRSIAPEFQESESEALLLVPWVWESYGNGRILDVADKKLGMDFDPKQFECLVIVGLWCAHPSHDQRPSIRQVLQALHFEAPLPTLPRSMPLPNYNVPVITPRSRLSEPIVSNMTLTMPR